MGNGNGETMMKADHFSVVPAEDPQVPLSGEFKVLFALLRDQQLEHEKRFEMLLQDALLGASVSKQTHSNDGDFYEERERVRRGYPSQRSQNSHSSNTHSIA